MENNAFRVKPTGTCKGAVIFLHGLGDDGEGWASNFKDRLSSYRKDLCFVFPNAPSQSVTLNGGMRMPSWFDLYGLSEDAKEDEKGIIKMSEEVTKTVEAIMTEYNLTPDKVVLGGFSQGGALALYTGLTSKLDFAGVVALSTWLPMRVKVAKDLKSHRFPIMFGHGSADPVVPTKWGEASANLLKSHNFGVEWKVYPGVQHSSCPQEFGDIKRFLDGAIVP